MSKGKQWWPLTATVTEAKQAVGDFQDRLRDRQWIKPQEGVALFHVYAVDGGWPSEHLSTVNDYMQISTHDPVIKNHGRAMVARLLGMLLKWHVALRPDAMVMAPPSVFMVPAWGGGFRYGLLATLAADTRKPGALPLTLMVFEQELPMVGSAGSGRVRHWVMPQTGDSYHWMTLKTWQDSRKKPSFGKWIYGSFQERKSWLDATVTSPQAASEAGLVMWHGPFGGALNPLKHLGGMYVSSQQAWVLPEFWEGKAVHEWLASQPPEAVLAKKPYHKARAGAQEASSQGDLTREQE